MKPIAIVGIVCATLLGIPALIVSPVVAIHYVNNWNAQGLVGDIKRLPLPRDTEILATRWDAGRMAPAGNGMNYSGAVLVRSSLSVEELKDYYAGIADTEGPEAIAVNAASKRGPASESFKDEFDLGQPDLFILTKRGAPSPNSPLSLDPRGH